MRQSRGVITSLVLVASTSLATGRLSAAAQNRPVETSFDITLPAGAACAFPVGISGQGKAKQIDLGHNRSIFTSPGLHVTVTNLNNPSTQLTNLNVTGAFHVTTEPDGSVVTVSTGRSLLFDPQAGFVLAIGHFSYIFDAAGNLTQPLTGKGQLIDICAMIE